VGELAKSSVVVIQAVDAGFFIAPPKAHPSRVYVVSYRDGHLRSFTGAPSATDRIGARFCYLVETGEQHSTNTCTVTSSVDAYSFSVELGATWRVTDPEAAVRAGLFDPSGLVLATVQDAVWQIARGYQPEQAAAAEKAVRASLAREIPLGSGVVIVRAVARFYADAAVTGATRDRDTASHQAALERDRMKQLRDLFDGTEAGALMIHLLQHPDDTGTVLGLLKDNREKEQALRLTLLDHDRQHYLAMLDRALENNLINDSDAQPLRDLLFGQAASTTLTGSVTMVPMAPKPTLSLPPGVAAGTTATTPNFAPPSTPPSSPGKAPAAGPPVAQGYVVDAVDTPVEDEDPSSPGSAPNASPGGVAGWKPIKSRSQGSE
jgi:hypothetical protein